MLKKYLQSTYKKLVTTILKQIFLGTVRTKQTSSYFKYGVYENLTLTCKDNIKIKAALFVPPKINTKTKFCIFLHGSGTNRDDLSDLGNLRYSDCVLLIPDYRDFGDSEGIFEKHKVNYDVLACFDFLKFEFKATKINLIGFSFGTAISTEYIRFIKDLSELTYLPDTLTLIAPFSSFKTLLEEFRGSSFIKKIPLIWKIIESEFDYDTIKNLEGFTKPIYLYHGEYDPLIKPEHSYLIQKRYGCYLKIVGADHIRILINKCMWDEIEKILV